MASAQTLSFEKAIEYMDPMQVTDCLYKTLEFLQRNNNELYFPSISPYVEAFLVNLVNDTRNLKSKSFKYDENKKIASEIIEILELSRDVFRWTHFYENGNLLVYKKIFSNKIKMKPAKPSSIAHRLLQAQTQSTPNVHHASPEQANICHHAPESTNQSDPPVASTGFKLQFLYKTLAFIKDETEVTLFNEMSLGQAEYVYSLIKNRDKDVGFGFKSLYAPLWEAMEESSGDYDFEVTLSEASSSDTKVVILEKVPKNKSKKDKAVKKEGKPDSKNNMNRLTQKEDAAKNTQHSSNMPPAFPQLELVSNISSCFFERAVTALAAFAEDAARASLAFHQLAGEEIAFVKRVKTLAESSKVREMFPPQHRDLLWRLDRSIKQALETCKITTTVNEKDRSITLKKTPRFATPLPVSAAIEQGVAKSGARSKSLASAKTRDRSISKDRLIQFQKGGKLPVTLNAESTTDAATEEQQRERGRSRDDMTNRQAKLLEDLSTPLESDRGIRMMLLMGWNGGALGARGDGIMEPVMPVIDLPKKAGLGHVPPPRPPRVTARRPLDFRLAFLHGVYDLLLHGERQKEIQLKEPLVEKERKFVESALGSLNSRRRLALTAAESELVALAGAALAARPGLTLRPHYSTDLRTITLVKRANHLAITAKLSAPRPQAVSSSDVITAKPSAPRPQAVPSSDVITAKLSAPRAQAVPSSDVITAKPSAPRAQAVPSSEVIKAKLSVPQTVSSSDVITAKLSAPQLVSSSDVIAVTDDDADVLVTGYEVMTIVPHVDVSDMQLPASNKTVRRRALRLVFLAKLAEALQWDFQPRIVFKFGFLPPKKLIMFMHSIVDSLNRGGRHGHLLGWETAVYEDLRNIAWGSLLALETLPGSKYVFTRTPIITEDSLPIAGPNPPENNNDDKTDNRNQITNVNDCTKQMDVDEENSKKENNVVENNVSQILIKAIVKTKSNIKDAISNIDSNNKDDHLTRKSNDDGLKETSTEESSNAGAIVDNIQHNITDNVNVKDLNLIQIEVDGHIPTEIENTEGVAVKIKSECDISEPDVDSKGEVTNGMIEAKIKVRNLSELSDWDRDIQDLEMSIMNSDLNCFLKEENITDCDLEMAISDTDLNINIKEEKGIEYLNTKRPHSSSVCSQELDPKKVKIGAETDDLVVIMKPKMKDEKMTEELVKQVQTLIANELDKAGGFLPLLKCRGVESGGLVYSCHDEDDVAWLKKVASVANLDVETVLNDLCLITKGRELLIRINSYIPLDVRKIFRKFEIYNVGLYTKYWKVSHKHTDSTFIMFIVTVDEKSFKYICDEKLSLYCGIDKAQFSIIY